MGEPSRRATQAVAPNTAKCPLPAAPTRSSPQHAPLAPNVPTRLIRLLTRPPWFPTRGPWFPARLVWLSTRHTVAPKTPSLVFNTTRLAPNMPRRRSQHDSSGSQHTLLVDTDTVHRVMARGLLVGVTCDMFLSTFGRDRDTEKNKIFFEERKIFGLACRGSDRPRGRVTRHRPFSRATSWQAHFAPLNKAHGVGIALEHVLYDLLFKVMVAKPLCCGNHLKWGSAFLKKHLRLVEVKAWYDTSRRRLCALSSANGNGT